MSKLSENKMLNLQQQMRQNNEDLKKFMKDLDSWEADIKKRDEDLKYQKAVEETVLPPVRNSLEKKKKKKMKKKITNSGRGNQMRISSYDYRAWDKFDVDKACEEVEETMDKSSSEYETDEDWEMERKIQAAIIEKDKGNDYFKRGDYDSAIECYTKGLDLDPTNPLLPANRAMALLKQEKYGGAEMDCTVALSLDPLYTKAYLRRGTARMGLHKYTAAKEDYERVLSLEPQNKKAKSDLEIIEKELSKKKLVTHTDTEAAEEIGIVKAVFKAKEEKSKKPLKRIQIEEVGFDKRLERKSAIARVEQCQGQVKKDLLERDNKMFESFTAMSPADIGRRGSQSDSIKTVEDPHAKPKLQNNFDGGHETRQSVSEEKNCVSVGKNIEEMTLNLRKLNTGGEYSHGRAVSDVNERSNSDLKVIQTRKTGTDTQVSNTVSEGETLPQEKSHPTTAFQFQTDYKRMKNNPEAFYNYFKKISPLDYTKLFGEFLDSDVLLRVLCIFKDFYILNNEDFFKNMQSLTSVKRFSMTVMFFLDKEKQVVKDLIEHLKICGEHSDSEIAVLASKYK